MSSTGVTHTDVVVVGAGPTGLMLAGDLAEAGVRVTVLERRARESNVTRAFAVHARTMEELPRAAREYVAALEKMIKAPISAIGVGPGREETIVVRDLLD